MSSDRLIYGEYIDNPPRTSSQFADVYESILGKYDRYRHIIDNDVPMCRNDLHPMEGDNLSFDRGYYTCLACRKASVGARNERRKAARQALVDSRS